MTTSLLTLLAILLLTVFLFLIFNHLILFDMNYKSYKVRFFDRYENDNFTRFMVKLNNLGSTVEYTLTVNRTVIDFDNEVIEYTISFELYLPEIHAEYFENLLHTCNQSFYIVCETI